MVDPITRFFMFRRAGGTKRFHTEQMIAPPDVAKHSWGVAMLCDFLYDYSDDRSQGFLLSRNLLIYALYHDMGEGTTGDTPSPLKRGNTKFAQYLREGDKVMDRALGIIDFSELTDYEALVFTWADGLDAMITGYEEHMKGNHFSGDVFHEIESRLRALSPPSPTASLLLNKLVVAYGNKENLYPYRGDLLEAGS